MKALAATLFATALGLALTSCGADDPVAPAARTSALPALGDVERGRDLARIYECSRCHEGGGLTLPTEDKQCFGCHQRILDGNFGSIFEAAMWRPRVAPLHITPSLDNAKTRLERGWIYGYLVRPHVVRPGLAAQMPRLDLSAADANDIATFLTREQRPAPDVDLASANLAHGREVMEAKGCGTCHAFTGVSALPGQGDKNAADLPTKMLAPDLRYARDRMTPGRILAWLRSPTSVDPNAKMPLVPLSFEEERDVTAYLVSAKLGPVPKRAMPERLPLLKREVGWDEVAEKVFRRTCWHCHAEADYAIGDGGPGNTGGFGFKPRGLDLAEIGGIHAGVIDDSGERRSVFAPIAHKGESIPRDPTSLLVRAMLARQREEAGEIDPDVRGMPLGFPALAPEDVQLVETWIAQGHRRVVP